MLYALLVEGLGPLGSVFSREDFSDSEIKDTDNDGVPEFVDGWGEPIQFYRWPVAHHSGIAEGRTRSTTAPPSPASEPAGPERPAHGASPGGADNYSTNIGTPSLKCLAVQHYFGPLVDPNWVSGTPNPFLMWDRSGRHRPARLSDASS